MSADKAKLSGPSAAGALDCYQDRCENTPFASVGGLEARHAMRAPDYIEDYDAEEYLEGYRAQADEMFGQDWRTCSFEWAPALVIQRGSDR